MTSEAHFYLLLGYAPLAVIISYYDLKYRQIPNPLVLATLTVFVIIGALMLEWQVYAIQLGLALAGAVVLIVLYLLVNIGGGDVKYAAALLPYIDWGDWRLVVVLLSLSTLALYLIYKLKGGKTLPLGVPLSITAVLYLVLAI